MVSRLVQTVVLGTTGRSSDLLTGAVAGTAWHDAGPTTLPATTNAATALRTARSHPLSTSTSLRHTASHGSSCDAAISCVEDPGTITISTHGGGDQQPRKKTVQYRKMLSAPVIRSPSISRRDLDDVVSTGHPPELRMTVLEQVCGVGTCLLIHLEGAARVQGGRPLPLPLRQDLVGQVLPPPRKDKEGVAGRPALKSTAATSLACRSAICDRPSSR